MGGGAGIRFTIKDFLNSSVEVPLRNVSKIESPLIERFDALGYSDGMQDVDGRLFSPLPIDIDSESINVESGGSKRATVALYFDIRYSTWETLLFGGYVRSEVHENLVFSFDGEVEFEILEKGQNVGGGSIPVTLNYALTEEGVYWYKDVFVNANDVPEEEWESYLSYLQENYGYRDPSKRKRRGLTEGNKGKTFEQWMKEVDDVLEARIGLSSLDIADCCYRDWYDDGVTPKSAASRAIRNEREG